MNILKLLVVFYLYKYLYIIILLIIRSDLGFWSMFTAIRTLI